MTLLLLLMASMVLHAQTIAVDEPRSNDRSASLLKFEGKPVTESIVEVKPGDSSTAPVTRKLKGGKGDQLILTLEGQFGRGEPLLEAKGFEAAR